MACLSLDPVSAALYSTLNVTSLQALAPGGIGDHIGQRVPAADGSFATFVLFEVAEDAQLGGFGTKPGQGALPQVSLRVHVFFAGSSLVPGQQAMAEVIRLLSASNALSVSGYTVCGTEPFYDQTKNLGQQLVAGVEVTELVSLWRLYVEEA